MDLRLRKGKPEFRPGRGTVEQIFILRNVILEQVNGWNATVYFHFVAFEKAFDHESVRGSRQADRTGEGAV